MFETTPQQIRIAFLGERGAFDTAALLRSLHPGVELVPAATAEIIGVNLYGKEPFETDAQLQSRIAAVQTALQQNPAAKVVAVVDNPETLAACAKVGSRLVKLATEYGAAADWHQAITSATANRVSFVLQGPAEQYFRGRILAPGRFKAQNVGLALVMLAAAGVPFSAIEPQAPQGTVDYPQCYSLESVSAESDPQWIVDRTTRAAALDILLGEILEFSETGIAAIVEPVAENSPQQELLRGAYLSHACTTVYVVTGETGEGTQLLQGLEQAAGRAKVIKVATLTAALRQAAALEAPVDAILYAGQQAEIACKLITEMQETK